jgi:hypothetical protein
MPLFHVPVTSDNGASQEGGPLGYVNSAGPRNPRAESFTEKHALIADVGGQKSHSNFRLGWAMAANTPLRRYCIESRLGFFNFISWTGLDIGRDRGSPVSHYEAPFEFTGKLIKVTVTTDDEQMLGGEGIGCTQMAVLVESCPRNLPKVPISSKAGSCLRRRCAPADTAFWVM